ncbi:3-methyl-2-oxobutanoate hydroxymethyltransferase [Enterobacter cloacae]|uniref:3-methyl-2-oxobutanoate hydroxymethyltransferase n=1 Tax=Enterobacter cloacae TaxID=550 RepID=A0A377M6I2_ENTCL|nr:3-methyl-2-oxobutanoate hydroxymethyltransferase [Enterobacter cloacae]
MKPTTISLLQKCKQEKRRFATITAYDYSFAKLFAEEGINVMLVGDSLGMTVQGHDSTLPVTVEDIAYHTRAVRRGAPACLLLSDLPFYGLRHAGAGFDNAAAVMRAGANMVKIEGGAWLVETVRMLTERAVPVCGHLGLTPQSVNIFGVTRCRAAVMPRRRCLTMLSRWKRRAHSCWCWNVYRLSWQNASPTRCLFRSSGLGLAT